MRALVFPGCPGTDRPKFDRALRPTAFLDRDGVLNVDRGYVCKVEDFEWIPGVFDACERLRGLGFQIAVVTNQSGVGRKLYSLTDFLDLTEWMVGELPVDAVVYCPHSPDAHCPARKPGTAQLESVDQVLGVAKDQSFLVGDKPTDIQAAEAFGVPGHLFTGGNLDELVARILGL